MILGIKITNYKDSHAFCPCGYLKVTGHMQYIVVNCGKLDHMGLIVIYISLQEKKMLEVHQDESIPAPLTVINVTWDTDGILKPGQTPF